MTLAPGQILNNRYRIVSLLGQGGFGAVYRAWDLTLKRVCALKENLDTSPEAQQQFGREALLLAKLQHPNLARVLDYFLIVGQGQYYVMDFVDGQDLQEMIYQQGRIREDQAMVWISQICSALSYLHGQTPPIIHRDIKPANIKITPDGVAKLVDFGIAKVYDPATRTTKAAQAVTPGYSPPEQYGMGSTDARSDIYALGATLYAALTGAQPMESVQRVAGFNFEMPRAINPAISPKAEAIVLQAMQLSPTQRFTSAAALRQALQSPVMVAPPPAVSAEPYQAAATTILPAAPNRKAIWILGSVAGVGIFGIVSIGIILLFILNSQGRLPWQGSSNPPAPAADNPRSSTPTENPSKQPPSDRATVPPISSAVDASVPTEAPHEIVTGSGLRYIDLTAGQGNPAAAADTVKVDYTGWLVSGVQFDSSESTGPFQFNLGSGGVIAGFDEGITGMRVGGKRRLIIPPELGYGSDEMPVIPANSWLIFDVELVEILGKTTAPIATPTPTPTSTQSPTPTRTPTPWPDTATPTRTSGELIAFNSTRSSSANDIYIIRTDGTGEKQLTFDVYDDRVPSWSPDGKEIAYQANSGGDDYEIMVFNLASGRIRQVTNNSCNDYAPTWSPDGRLFSFYSDCDGNREIYTMNIDGSNLRQLTHTNEVVNWFPVWSWDGRQITFSSYLSGYYQVYVMNPDGSNLAALGRGCVSSFSPDGSKIVFTSYCTDAGEIYVMNADGTGKETIFDRYESTNPSWSPDGTQIIFQAMIDGDYELCIIDASGENFRQITSNNSYDSAPVWQP